MTSRHARVLVAAILVLGTVAISGLQKSAPASDATARAVTAAEAFLATLDQGQRAKANIDLNEKTRTVWSNLPTGSRMQVGRHGTQRPQAGRHEAGAGEGRARARRGHAEP